MNRGRTVREYAENRLYVSARTVGGMYANAQIKQ